MGRINIAVFFALFILLVFTYLNLSTYHAKIQQNELNTNIVDLTNVETPVEQSVEASEQSIEISAQGEIPEPLSIQEIIQESAQQTVFADEFYPHRVQESIYYKCLSTDEVAQMVSDIPQFFLAFAEPFGGKSLKKFMNACLGEFPADFNPYSSKKHVADKSKEDIVNKPYLVPFISDMLDSDESLLSLIEGISSTSLMFLSRSAGPTRLASSIKYVVGTSLYETGAGDPATQGRRDWGKQFKANNGISPNMDTIPEDALIELISQNAFEIGLDDSHVLTCKVNEGIQRNKPKLVYMDDSRLGEIQNLLAAKYCPGQEPFRESASKYDGIPVTIADKSTHSLVDWVEAKLDVLEFSLYLKKPGECQSEVRKSDEALASCPSGFVEVIGSGHYMWMA